MQERGVKLSRDSLFKFLDFAAKRGLINKKTVENRRRACKAILDILEDVEAADLSKIDLEDVILRHRTLAAGSIPPSSLRGHESHVRGAVRDFLEYSKNPTTWKPSQQRTRKVPKVKLTGATGKLEEPEEDIGMPRGPSVHVDLQIHISPEATPEQIDQIFDSISRHLPWK